MNIIHSFWSKPSYHNNQDFYNSRKFGGWKNYRIFLLGSAFSCLTLRKYHGKISLYTDSQGYDLFINVLNLPYDEVSQVLNVLSEEDHRLWILGKIMAIKDQKAPFVHVDNDVFIWKELPCSANREYLVGQSLQPVSDMYRQTLQEVQNNFAHVHECLQTTPPENKMIVNVGLIGGNNIDFFQEFCEISLNLLEKNRDKVYDINIGSFNQIMEEYLFSRLAEHKGLPIHCHIDSSQEKRVMGSVLRFNLVPLIDKYIHLVGLAKQDYFACEQLELRMKYEFPDYYDRIIEMTSKKSNEPKKQTEEFMRARQERLISALKTAYNCSMRDFGNLKIRISPDCVKKDVSSGDDDKYTIREINPVTGKPFVREAGDGDAMLFYFESPTTVNEIISEVQQNSDCSEEELDALRLQLLDSVTDKLLFTGSLELA